MAGATVVVVGVVVAGACVVGCVVAEVPAVAVTGAGTEVTGLWSPVAAAGTITREGSGAGGAEGPTKARASRTAAATTPASATAAATRTPRFPIRAILRIPLHNVTRCAPATALGDHRFRSPTLRLGPRLPQA
jgi:hypothetical protein